MSQQVRGPAMICATDIMRSGPTRIGSLGSITFPRTIPVVTLFAVGIGAFVGMAVATSIASGFNALMYGSIFGGGAGWFLVNYSPLQGESMLKWFELQFQATRRGRYIDGERVALGVGTALLPRPPLGPVQLLRSAVRIPSSQYDERGVLITAKNQNLPDDGTIDPLLFAALSLPDKATSSLTPVTGVELAGGPSRRPDRAAAARSAEPDASVVTSKPRRLKD